MTTPIILDTQLMVLLAVGLASPTIIAKHKNLTKFTLEDFELLLLILGTKPLVLLPNIVSEAANLLRHHKEPEKGLILMSFAELVRAHRENYVESGILVSRRDYRRLGITDTAIIELCRTESLEVITADAELYTVATNHGLRATNFNHRREEFGLL